MKFITTQMATNELVRETQMKQDESIKKLGKEVEKLTELVIAMKSINQSPSEPQVSLLFDDSDESNDVLLLQDEYIKRWRRLCKNRPMTNLWSTM